MKVEKVPDSTYDMIGGCDQQIKEIKEVRWLCLGAVGNTDGTEVPAVLWNVTLCYVRHQA